MRYFALITLLGLALAPVFTQTTKPVKKSTSTAKPKPGTTAHKPAASHTTAHTTPTAKPKPKTTASTKPATKAPSTTSKPKPTAAKPASTQTTSSTKPKPKSAAANKPDEKTEWEKASTVTSITERVAALQKFNKTFPKSAKRNDALELIAASRGEMGNKKMVAGDIAAAIELFKSAATDAPKPPSDPLFLESLSKFPANLFFRGQRDAAFEIAKVLEEKSDTNVSHLLAIAAFYMSVESGSEAKRIAEIAIKLNPDSSPAWQTLGLANRMDFLLEESANAYAKALAIEPDSLSARRGLAEMKRSLGRADESVTLYREILAKDDANLPAQTGLILSLFDAEKRTEAEAELTKSLTANPGNVILLAGAAYWYAAHNEGDRAVDLAQKSIAVDPRFIWSHVALARGLMAQKKPIDAEKALLVARRYGDFPTLEYEIASARLAAGFYREAAEELAKSFTVKEGVVHTNLGGRVPRESRSFTELVGPERRASIFAPTAADDPENAARLVALLELKQELDSTTPKPDAAAKAADAFVKGDDKMKVHRQIFAASQLLDKKVALPKVLELAKDTVANVEAGLDVPFAAAAVLASELYESRAIAGARGEYLNVPPVSRFTLSAILRGRVEEIGGWALYEMDNPADSVLRLKRAVSVLPVDSAWWRSGMWRLGSALAITGKDAEALDAYIKCYKSGTADITRYGVIETLYKRVNGNTDGLEARIGAKPAPSAQIAQLVEPKPTPEVKVETPAETKPEAVPAATPEVKINELKSEPTPEAKIESPAESKAESLATVTPVVKIYTPNPQATPAKLLVAKLEPTPTPELKTETPPTPSPTITPEVKPDAPRLEPVPTPTPEVKTNEPKTEPPPTPTPESKSDVIKPEPTPAATPEIKTDAPKTEPTPDASKTGDDKPKETVAEVKSNNATKDLFPSVVIKIPPRRDTSKQVTKEPTTTPEPSPTPVDAKPAEEAKPSKTVLDKTGEAAANTGESRTRVVDSKPETAPEIKPCILTASEESLSLKNGGSDLAVIIGIDGDGELEGLTATSSSPKNVSVIREPISGVTSRAIFVVKSISPNTGIYQIKFELPCGKKEVLVKVK